MDRIRKIFRRVSIPAAFIICGLSCLLAALGLTKLTMWFAQKHMNEIESEYEFELGLQPQILYDTTAWDIGATQDLVLQTPPDVSYNNIDSEQKIYWGKIRLQNENFPQDVDSDQEATVQQVQPFFSYDADSEQELQGRILYEVSSYPEKWDQMLAADVVLVDRDAFQETAQVKYELEEVVFVGMDAFQETDQKKYDFFEGLDSTAAVLWYSVCLCIAAVVFYLWKIKKPFGVLNQAVQKISENNLNYRIDYDGQDEFGHLCHAFEVMRQELVHNNRKMWNSVEERKRLNAAFAHDLRTPLTVLRGHADLLLDALSEDMSANREVTNSVHAISQQITRLNAFVDTMGTLQRLEDYEPCPKRISPSSLSEMVSETAALLFPNGKVEVHSELGEGDMQLDWEAFAQICENILSNAARYAGERITVSLRQKEGDLILCVEDDGIGFSKKDLASASLAYYRGEKTEAGAVTHFGLGLYICNLLAEKMGGDMSLSNGTDGGGKVTVKCPCKRGQLTHCSQESNISR